MRINPELLILLLPILTACVTVGGEPPTRNEKISAINVQLGLGYLQQNNLQQANQKLLKALSQNSNSALAHKAYAILQERLLQKEVAAKHYKIAIELDPDDWQTANHYGKLLCLNGRALESEKYFLSVAQNPQYKTPEYAYLNAAQCLLKIDKKTEAKRNFNKALAAKSDFGDALIEISTLELDAGNFDAAKRYIDRFHLVQQPSARSLWLAIRSELGMDETVNVEKLGQQLESGFPNSDELKSWLQLQ